jgi:hypothetical protein
MKNDFKPRLAGMDFKLIHVVTTQPPPTELG